MQTIPFDKSFTSTELDADFVLPLEDKTVKEEESVEFTVELTKPKQKVIWEKNGVEVTPQDGIEIASEGNICRLRIKKASLDDEGNYTIILPSGKKSNAKLTVEGKDGLEPRNGFLIHGKFESCRFIRLNDNK